MVDVSPRAGWMVSRFTHVLSAAALVAVFGLATPTAGQVSDQSPTVTVTTLTPERIVASAAAVVGLIGAIIGGLALLRSVRRIGNSGRRGAIVALILGPISLVTGGLIVATADGGLGTGNGIAGGFVAIALSLIGMALSGLALVRSHRTA